MSTIASYLAARNPEAKQRVIAAIRESLRTLANFPMAGHRLDVEGLRHLVVLKYPYMIIYRTAGDEVLVLHVRRASRKPVTRSIGSDYRTCGPCRGTPSSRSLPGM